MPTDVFSGVRTERKRVAKKGVEIVHEGVVYGSKSRRNLRDRNAKNAPFGRAERLPA
jgi:hypothetical protein